MVPALAFTLLATIALAYWARWLGGQYGVPPFVRHLAWLVVGVWVLGAAGSVLGLWRAFGMVSEVDPSQKARMLAEGISEAMNAFALSTGILLLVGIAGRSPDDSWAGRRMARGAGKAGARRIADPRRTVVPSQGREPPYARDFPMHRDMQPRRHESSGLGLTWKYKWAAKPPEAPRNPPYR